MVWVPGPVCQWLPTEEANAELARLQMTLASVHVLNDASFRAPRPEGAATPPARLLVAGSPGDVVQVGGARLDLSDGFATAVLPEGRADVRVVGGGRVLDWPVGLADGNVVWLAIEPPEATRIAFTTGSAALSPMAVEQIRTVVEHAGNWSFEVHGSASPEGSASTNRALQDGRARVVADALIAAGVPTDRVKTGASRVYPGLTPEEQRAAMILPVER
jgi:outer membrane protein OmpA-like peptidoglycan-associated protein